MKRFFWRYYGIAILANVVAVIVFREHVHISWHSLFPIGYISLMLFYGFFAPSKKAAEALETSYEDARIIWGHSLNDPPLPSAEEIWQENKRTNIITSKIYFAFVPPIFFFVCFFSNLAKFLSGLFLFSAMIVHILFLCYLAKEDIRIQNLETEKNEKNRKKRNHKGNGNNSTCNSFKNRAFA